ncbi:MAG TPA: hypothetical protein PKG54_13950 [Phycisphaerae bacterium]|nr:hypothetical protein [Phycisphaerae bacterium]HOB75615.1 hypothetical protein [Phycisphaerae bacterium]HOJ56364.1 hypothetical protein [Phycisphaerae bacterium]HOL28161.1 hypothetical protein [Phycisphaerae bacterium]HPP22600.1 hypothetical protein [Phycisphaerae bacterium]
MSELERSARRAQRRLLLNRWLTALGWSMAGAAGLFIITICIGRSLALLEESGRFYGWLTLGLVGGAVAGSALWAWLTRENLPTAAARLDEAAGLKERISTGLFCATSADPFARAVVADAERVSRALPLNHYLPVRVPRSAPWAGAVTLTALLSFWLFPTLDLLGKQERQQETIKRQERIERTAAVLKPVITPTLKKLQESNPELKKELEDLEMLKDAKLETPADLRQEMMKKVEKISEKLEQKAQTGEMAQVEEFKKMMNRLANEPKSNTPVSELTKALARGDFNAAQEAVKSLQEQLSKEAKTPEEKQKAEQMKQELQQLSEKLNQIAQDDKKMREQLAKTGMNDQEIREALEKLAQKDMEGLKKQLQEKGLSEKQAEQLAQQIKKRSDAGSTARKLAQCLSNTGGKQGQQSGEQGEMESLEGLTDAAEQLSELEAMEQSLNELKASMSQVGALKNRIGESCSQCNGTGMVGDGLCTACQGSGMGNRPGGGGYGSGMGALGQGEGGVVDYEQTRYNTVQRKAQVNTQAGSVISRQEFDGGMQFKGEVSKEFSEAVISAQREVADNIANEKIPRPYQRSLSEYFKRSAEDMKTPPAK